MNFIAYILEWVGGIASLIGWSAVEAETPPRLTLSKHLNQQSRSERVGGIEPPSRPWQGRIIATIRYPQYFKYNQMYKYYKVFIFFRQDVAY